MASRKSRELKNNLYYCNAINPLAVNNGIEWCTFFIQNICIHYDIMIVCIFDMQSILAWNQHWANIGEKAIAFDMYISNYEVTHSSWRLFNIGR